MAKGAGAKGAGRKRSTIYDIAEAAETSASTVSLVLNGTWRRYRINADTAERVTKAAQAMGYNANLRARGLRLRRSSLAGMAIPHYRNRFFAGLAEAFEAEARRRGLCPIVVSTQRDPATERVVVETLVAQQAEMIIITGVNGPDELDGICADAGIPCVNLDLPGSRAPSVVSDNRGGARRLAEIIVRNVRARGGDLSSIRFVGGNADEYATEERAVGFAEALAEFGENASPERIVRCGYRPKSAEEVFDTWRRGPERFPAGLFVNSITALEGFAAFMRREPALCREIAVGCFDWDPFAASLPLAITMMRQDVERLIAECFVILDEGVRDGRGRGETVVVPPTLEVVSPPAGMAAS